MSNSPLPCPFCGAAPRVKVWPNDPYNLRGCVEVSCENNYCPVQVSAEENSIEAATANWNARVTPRPEARPRILDAREVKALAKKAGLAKYVWDTDRALMDLARFAHESALYMNGGGT